MKSAYDNGKEWIMQHLVRSGPRRRWINDTEPIDNNLLRVCSSEFNERIVCSGGGSIMIIVIDWKYAVGRDAHKM